MPSGSLPFLFVGLAGAALVVVGLALIYPPLALLAAGAGLIYAARCGVASLPVADVSAPEETP